MKVSDYAVHPLHVDDKLVKTVIARRKKGDSIATIARTLKIGQGKAAMAELVGTTKRVELNDSAALARAIAKDRKAGFSWGKLAAKYGVTEGTTRAAYESASGQPFSSIDLRRGSAKKGRS